MRGDAGVLETTMELLTTEARSGKCVASSGAKALFSRRVSQELKLLPPKEEEFCLSAKAKSKLAGEIPAESGTGGRKLYWVA